MSSERWGTLSVKDHQDSAGMAADILLYDRLIFPVPPDGQEETRWKQQGWAPDKQGELIKSLGDLAISSRWSEPERAKWTDQFQQLKGDTEFVVSEAKKELGFVATRMVLEQKEYPLPLGVDGIDIVSASRSKEAFEKRLNVSSTPVSEIVPNFGVQLRQRIAVPFRDFAPEIALANVIQFVKDSDFRRKRTIVYELQNRVLSQSMPPLEYVQELQQANEALIGYICLMTGPVAFNETFAIAALYPGQALGKHFPSFASPSIDLSALQLLASGGELPSPHASGAPIAIYHG